MSTRTGGTGGYRYLVSAVLRREVVIFLRYPANAVGLVIVNLLFFSVIFVGGTMLAGEAMADSIEGIIVGYLLWMMATTSYQGVVRDVQSEASWGTLERHFITPFGFPMVMASKAVAKLVFTFLYATVILVAMLLITRTMLYIDVVTVVPILLLALASVFGVGFAMAGVTVLYKNISSWTGLVNFAIVGLVAAPEFELGWTTVLPLVQGSAMLQLAMRDGVRLWQFDPVHLLVLAVAGVGYLLLGYVVFHRCQQRARKLGTLGDY